MRWWRRAAGVLLIGMGLVGVLVGAVVAAWAGPDDEVRLGRSAVHTEGTAVVTGPGLLSVVGPTLVVRAHSSGGPPLWLGVAHRSDLDSYLAGTGRTDLTRWPFPRAPDLVDHPGRGTPDTRPDQLDWWVAGERGDRPVVRWPLSDGRFGVVMLRADGRAGVTADVSAGLVLPGLFATATAVAGGGVVAALLGRLLSRRTRSRGSGRPRAGTSVTRDEPT